MGGDFMGAALRVFSAYLVVMGLAVGVHYAITPLYDDGSTGFPVWTALNWPMAVAVVVALAASGWGWVRQGGGGGGSGGGGGRDGAEGAGLGWRGWVNVRFYASVALALGFFNNWFADLMGPEPALEWGLVNILFVGVMLSCGADLWRSSWRRGLG